MFYSIYKLHFKTPVHFGKIALSNSEHSLCSDTIFSALCTEAVSMSDDSLNSLLTKSKEGKIQISDAFPYMEAALFLPKPYSIIERTKEDSSSIVRKAYKKLKYVAAKDFDSYLDGTFDVMSASSLDGLGIESVKVSASVRNDSSETVPYEIGLYSFNPGNGLYVIAGFGDQESESLFDLLVEQLSLSGLGGRRSSGYGRFDVEKTAPSEWLLSKLQNTQSPVMLLNTALPREDELESVLVGARYNLIKRSGFVSSASYADSWQRKKDIVMLKSGSCFENPFAGDIYDVSTAAGSHPVYRNGKPMFMRVCL